MCNKIFLNNLPRKGKGIDWQQSKGKTVHFIYNDLEGDLIIKEVYPSKHTKLLIQYKDKETIINSTHFTKCHLLKLLENRKITPFKYDIGYISITKNQSMTIIDRFHKDIKKIKNNKEYKKKEKYYKLKCNVCGCEIVLRQVQINKTGCGVCNGKRVVKGINDVATSRPDLVKYFVNKNDAFTHTKSSEEKVLVKCSRCNEKKYIRITDLNRYGLSCLCDTGHSYPERFIYKKKKKSNINFIYQYSRANVEWWNKYRYDFYLSDYNTILEVHGEQHYTHSFIGCGGDSLEDVKNNDYNKKRLALDNGINNYIELDCSKSNADFIINSIKNSNLINIINITKANIKECDIKANGDLIKIVCDKWNELKNVTKVLNEIDFIRSRTTIIKYLKRGTELGICNYNPNEELVKSIRKNSYTLNRNKYKTS